MQKAFIAVLAVAASLAASSSAMAVAVVAAGAPGDLLPPSFLGGGLADFESPASVTSPGNTTPPQGPFSAGDASFSGFGILMTGTTSGLYASPFHDDTQYLTVRPNGDTETVTFASKYSTLGLYWGSMDTYNSIDFYNGGVLKETVKGSQAAAAVLAAAQGLQTDDANNRYIIISAINGGLFDKIVLNSTSNSFELDNLEWGPAQAPPGPTPLPGALPLFVSGIGGLGFLRFWRKKKQT